MSGLSRCYLLCYISVPPYIRPRCSGTCIPQEGSYQSDYLDGAAAANREGVILAGYLTGNWSETTSGSFDFAAVGLDSDANVQWRWRVILDPTYSIFPE